MSARISSHGASRWASAALSAALSALLRAGDLQAVDAGHVASSYPDGYGPAPTLPAPSPPIGFNGATVIGWPQGVAPRPAPPFTVRAFARDIESPRWLHVLANGDVLVAQSGFSREVFGPDPLPRDDEDALTKAKLLRPSPNRITLLRDKDDDGVAEVRETFLDGVNHPFGMAVLGHWFYVAATDGLWRFPFRLGDTRIGGGGQKLLDLPAGEINPHWTRGLIAHPDGDHLYVTVGSITDVDSEELDQKDERRAAIIEVRADGSASRIFARGLRNATGLDWAPGGTDLWTVVNERDHLGPALPPDFLARVRDGGFYGWPFAYFGPNEDPAHAGERPDKVRDAIAPDYALGAHTAPLGLAFQRRKAPEPFREGAFISQHGSMRAETLSGFRVIFVPFANGRPSGPPIDVLTGFIRSRETREVYGRPAGLAQTAAGGLLVSDDAGDCIWLLEPRKN